jgi:hypothetical protein
MAGISYPFWTWTGFLLDGPLVKILPVADLLLPFPAYIIHHDSTKRLRFHHSSFSAETASGVTIGRPWPRDTARICQAFWIAVLHYKPRFW